MAPVLYQNLTELIKHQNHNVIAVGDWNLVLDPQLDCYNYKHLNNPKAKESVDNMMSELELRDIWRENNPDCKRYTWRKATPLEQSRLDYFLLSDALIWNFEDADIRPGYRSDHSIVDLKLSFGTESKRNTFWKCNCSLLKDKQYIHEINDEINSVIEEYTASYHDLTSITLTDFENSNLELKVPHKVFLDFLLMKIRSRTIAYATMKKNKASEKEKDLQEDIQKIERKQFKTEKDIKDFDENNKQLILLREKKNGGRSFEIKSEVGSRRGKDYKIFV